MDCPFKVKQSNGSVTRTLLVVHIVYIVLMTLIIIIGIDLK